MTVPSAYAVLAVRVTPGPLRAALRRAGVDGRVGAQDEAWTGAWDLDADPALLADLVAEELDATAVAVEVRADVLALAVSTPGRDLEPYRSSEPAGVDAAAIAAACGRPGVGGELALVLGATGTAATARHAEVTRVLGLPGYLVGGSAAGGEPVRGESSAGSDPRARPPGRAPAGPGAAGGLARGAGRNAVGDERRGDHDGGGLVLVRATPDELAAAADAAAVDGWSVPYDDSWSGFVPRPGSGTGEVRELGDDAALVVPAGRPGLVLSWSPRAAGFVLLRGGEVVCRHSWVSGVAGDRTRADAVASALCDTLGVPGRATGAAGLLCRTGEPTALLAELVGLLTLPAVPVGAPGSHVRAEAAERTGARRTGIVPTGPGPGSGGAGAGARPGGTGRRGGAGAGADSGEGADSADGAGTRPGSGAGAPRLPSGRAAALAAVLAVVALVLGLTRVLSWLQGEGSTIGGLLGVVLLAVCAYEVVAVVRYLGARAGTGGGP